MYIKSVCLIFHNLVFIRSRRIDYVAICSLNSALLVNAGALGKNNYMLLTQNQPLLSFP